MKIFLDIYLAFNYGDDLFLDVFSKRYPDADITLNHPGGEYKEFVSSYPNVESFNYTFVHKILRRLKLYDRIEDCEYFAKNNDALVFLGGSIFRDEPYHKELYAYRLNLVQAFKRQGKKVYIIGANFGPVESTDFVNDYSKLFALCDDVCFRDSDSVNYFLEHNNVRLAPDIIFGQTQVMDKSATKKQVSVSVTNFEHYPSIKKYQPDNIMFMSKLISKLAEAGKKVNLMSFCEKEGDMKTVNEICEILPDKVKRQVEVMNYDGNLNTFTSAINNSSVVVGTRFHATIIGLCAGADILPIIYSSKTLNMLADINMDKVHVKPQEMSNCNIDEILNSVTGNYYNTSKVSKESSKQFEKLDEQYLSYEKN